ncbi:uncharacterized protein LOC122512361 [Leptopilina heterotoma]|uniref:uncharacterized protein LOC122512361 n=1 Tax=Leptopilina heterotoma TaxID=63436 RepID=UPI001CAA025F|nr:uncharacterized protein LOC122512361 [Leptopilina heterotoma]
MAQLLMILVVVFCTAAVQSKIFRTCENNKFTPTDVRIRGCNKSPCLIPRGKKLNFEFDFAAPEATTTLKPKMTIIVGKKKINYDFDDKNSCDNLISGKCPLKKSDKATYSLETLLPKKTPLIKAAIQLEFLDDKGKSLTCGVVDVKVVRK